MGEESDREDHTAITMQRISNSSTASARNSSNISSSEKARKGSNISSSERAGGSSLAHSLRDLSEKVVSSRNGKKPISNSLAQLRISNMHLHGRDEELKLLATKLRDLTRGSDNDGEKKDTPPELLMISGISGSGKSALVFQGLRDPAQKRGAVFGSGKFDLTNKSLPLSAFADAMASLTKEVLDKENAKRIKESISKTIGESDKNLLSQAMPGCEGLFSLGKSLDSNTQKSSGSGKKEDILRLQYAIRRLLKVICSLVKGVVLHLDDMQWSDSATLDLIKSISYDNEIPSLLIVGAYREDEVTENHPLSLFTKEKEKLGTKISLMNIGNLSSDNVMSLVAEALGMDEDKVETLATTVYSKTDGNPFFVLVFLKSLYDEGLLTFNFGAMKWLWDDQAVKDKFMTENVATIMINKLRSLQETEQSLLKIASCLGASFSLSVIATVMESLKDCIQAATPTISSYASKLVEEGLWERECEKRCRFSHDQIQSASYNLIDSDDRDTFRGEIGSILMKRLDPSELEEHLFEVVSLRNCSVATLSEDERAFLADMNLRAGLKASNQAAFDTAAIYYKTGHDLLGANAWESDHSRILELCSKGAETCFINGDLETMDILIDEVMSKDIEVMAKFQVFEVKVMSAMAANKLHEAINTAIAFRRQLGLSTPRNKPVSTFTVLKEFAKTTRVLKKRSAEEIASLPELTNIRIIMGQRMLELLFTSTYLSQPTLTPLISFLLVRTSVKHGINASSCEAFSTFGLLLCGGFGQLQRGREMAEAVDLMLNKPGMRRMEARSQFMCQVLIYHWTCPLHKSLAPLTGAYHGALETGDIETACYCLLNLCSTRFFTGRSLESCEKEFESTVSVLRQLNQVPQSMFLHPHLLVIKKLRGTKYDKEELDFDAMLDTARETKNDVARAVVMIAQLDMLVFFQHWEAAKVLLLEAGDLRKLFGGEFTRVRFTIVESLICLKVAQAATSSVQRRKWKKRGFKSMKMIRGWLKKGNVNVVHTMHLLSAERAAMEGRHEEAEESFKLAIQVATKNGFVSDKGLTHALAAKFYADRKDDYWKDYNIECSQKSYKEWGANALLGEL